ncbi:RTA1 like protein-domain-containing protein [Xylariales sp. PMI_506]|nr:RTA1 like protein-domain-containing protein [Xylariales sp. PMI_506]
MAAGGAVYFVYYHYNPSIVAAAIFVSLFGISTIIHIVQLSRRRTWYFIPFVLGGIAETIGYGGRIGSALQTPNWTLKPYIIQSLLLLISPAMFAASIYMILGRIVKRVDGAKYSVIPVRWLTKIFVASDILSFLLQGSGGGLLAVAKDLNAFNTGQNVIIGGLFVQLVGFSIFVVVASIFHRRIVACPTATSESTTVPWQRYLFVLYAVSGLILVRSIFRVIEYIQGWNGYLQSVEYWLYIFDAVLMFSTSALLNIFHPSSILPAKATDSSRTSYTSHEVEVRRAPSEERKPSREESSTTRI